MEKVLITATKHSYLIFIVIVILAHCTLPVIHVFVGIVGELRRAEPFEKEAERAVLVIVRQAFIGIGVTEVSIGLMFVRVRVTTGLLERHRQIVEDITGL